MAQRAFTGGWVGRGYGAKNVDAFFFNAETTDVLRRLTGYISSERSIETPQTPLKGLGGTMHGYADGIQSLSGTLMVRRETYWDMLVNHKGSGERQKLNNSFQIALNNLGQISDFTLVAGVNSQSTGNVKLGTNNLDFGKNTFYSKISEVTNSGKVANYEVFLGMKFTSDNAKTQIDGNPIENVTLGFVFTQYGLISAETPEEVISEVIKMSDVKPYWY